MCTHIAVGDRDRGSLRVRLLRRVVFGVTGHGRLTFLMATCPSCHEQPPICTHGVNAANNCVAFEFARAVAARGPNAVYPPSVRNSLPAEVRQLDGSHLDCLLNVVPAAAAVLVQTPAEVLLIAGIVADTTVNIDIGPLMVLAERFPGNIPDIRRNYGRLLGPANVTVSAQIGVGMAELREISKAAVASAPVATATTALFNVTNYPKATLLQVIVKNVERGEEFQEATVPEYLDPTTGKKYTPFAKSVKASSVVNLMYVLQVFTITLTGLTGEAPSVYFRLTKEVTRVAATRGARQAQEFLDAILRKLDEGVFTNVVALFKSGEQNRVLTDLAAVWDAEPPTPADKKDTRTDPRPRIKFTAVTQPLGGPGAAVINDYVTKQPKLCSRYHATPRQPCTAGLPVGHVSGCAGQCAFKH